MRTLFALSVAAVAAASQATIMFDLNVGGGVSSVTVDNEASGVTGVGYSRGSGIQEGPASSSTFNSQGFGVGNDFATALAEDETLNWSFSSTTAWNLTSFDIRIDRSGSGPDDVQLDFNDGNGWVTVLTHDYNDSGAGVDFLAVDMTAFDNVTSGEFRLVAYAAESENGTFDFETVDFGGNDPRSFRLEGEAVPEPATMAVLAGLGLVAARRRKKA